MAIARRQPKCLLLKIYNYCDMWLTAPHRLCDADGVRVDRRQGAVARLVRVLTHYCMQYEARIATANLVTSAPGQSESRTPGRDSSIRRIGFRW